jgi:transposase
MCVPIEDMRRHELYRRIAELDQELAEWARNEEAARRLMTIPGIRCIEYLIAAIGRADSFARGRDLAAWLGLVPRQVTTGGKPRYFG